jgi:hypothetical protein
MSASRPSVVVGLPGQDLVPPVELLEQHDPCQLMRQCQLPEREPVVNLIQVEAKGTADHEAQVSPALAPLLQEAAEVDRV